MGMLTIESPQEENGFVVKTICDGLQEKSASQKEAVCAEAEKLNRKIAGAMQKFFIAVLINKMRSSQMYSHRRHICNWF